MKSREIHLRKRPAGIPTEDNFALVTVDLPALQDGEVLVQNLWMSVDPYMRGRMDDIESYIPPFQLGEALDGDAVGRVIESKHSDYQVGDRVHHLKGWREYAICCGDGLDEVMHKPELTKIDTTAIPASAYLGVIGMPGRTAYAGLEYVAKILPGETVYISGAAGAVGSAASQIAKLKGCRVVGSAGSNEKVDWLLNELGIDAAINYKTVDNIELAIAEACPHGIDVYFENVGGPQMDAVLNVMNDFGRIALCGLISDYNTMESAVGPKNFAQILTKSLMVKGFIVTEFDARAGEYEKQMAQWIAEGKIKWRETVLNGIESAPQALIGLFKGTNCGKMLVKFSEET